MTKLASSLALLLAVSSACADQGAPPTGAACPTANAPTYQGFGKAFMTTYCVGCHSQSAQDRHGAPRGLNFDNEEEVRRHAVLIDGVAGAGPNATNTSMPVIDDGAPAPTAMERQQLAQALACMQAP